MSITEYKPTNCQNCGGYSHCGSPYWRTEKDYKGEYYQIEVCKNCICKECTQTDQKS